MSTLAGRTRTGLLVIDVQVGVVADALDRGGVVSRISGLVDRARGEGVPVVWIQHDDDELHQETEEWQFVPNLMPGEGEPVVPKSYGDAFEETRLEEVLAERGIGRLVVMGAKTDQCIRSTIHGALTRGYDVMLVADAHTTDDASEFGAPPPGAVIAHTNFYWADQEAPGRVAAVADAAAVTFDA